MSFSDKYNKEKLFKVDMSSVSEYYTLEQLFKMNGEDTEFLYEIKAVYENKHSSFGQSAVLVIDLNGENVYVNIPSHLALEAISMLSDNETIDDINNGKAGFKIYSYNAKKFNKICYSIRWVDLF